ncbi:MAG: peptidylprolyl isomerase [Terriglobales bacterium]
MKRFFLIAVLLMAVSAATGQTKPSVASHTEPAAARKPNGTLIEDIIARVNNHIITRSEYKRNLDQVAVEMKNQGITSDKDPKLRDAEANLLRDMIDQQLLLQKASDLGLSADTELVKRLDEFRKQMNLDSMEDLEKAAEQQGVSYEDFKQNLRNNILTQKVIQQEVGSKIHITSEEIQQYYNEHKSEFEVPEQVRLSEILIADDGTDPAKLPQSEAKANQVLQDIHGGMLFEDAARKFSNGPTAAQGGDLGMFKRGTLAKGLEEQTFAMQKGQLSGVIRTRQGFVILKVTEHTAGGLQPLRAAEPRIQEALYLKKLAPTLREYLTKMREQAFIDIKPGFVDTGASPFQTKPIIVKASAENSFAPEKAKKKKKFGIF